MKFLCGSCQTKYQISEEKVRGKILTIRCQKCGAKVIVRETSATSTGETIVAKVADEKAEATVKARAAGGAGSARPRQAGPAPSSAIKVSADFGLGDDNMATTVSPTPAMAPPIEWFSAIDGVQSGPFTFEELVQKVAARELLGQHYVWHQAMDGWKRIRETEELQPYVSEPKAHSHPPPPPRGATPTKGADVVDFASKRAELERTRKTESTKPAPSRKPSAQARHIEERAPATSPGPERKKDRERDTETQAPAPSKRLTTGDLEQTVSPAFTVLEGHTSTGHGPAIDFAKDDIFAHIPRLDPNDEHAKESTRFFVAAAGVKKQAERARYALYGGLAGGAAFLLFMMSWAVGWVQISLPGVGNPFAHERKDDSDYERQLREAEEKEKKRKLGDDWASDIKITRAPRPRGVRAGVRGEGDNGPQDSLPGVGTRGGDPERVKIDPLDADPLHVSKPEFALDTPPDSKVPAVPVSHSDLRPEAVQQVVAARRSSVAICYSQSLKANEGLRGRIEFALTVKTTGEVTKVQSPKKTPQTSGLIDCIADKLKHWRFPAFTGDDALVQVPFVLEQGY